MTKIEDDLKKLIPYVDMLLKMQKTIFNMSVDIDSDELKMIPELAELSELYDSRLRHLLEMISNKIENEEYDQTEYREENTILRELLWLNHEHPSEALYGDDGERQCHQCLKEYGFYDYIRTPAFKIRELIEKANMQKWIKEQNAKNRT